MIHIDTYCYLLLLIGVHFAPNHPLFMVVETVGSAPGAVPAGSLATSLAAWRHFEDAARRWTRSVQVDETCEDSKIRWILYGFLVNFCAFLWMFIVYRFLWMFICFFREFYAIFMVFNGCLWSFFWIFMDFWWMVFDVKIQKLEKAIWKTMVT